MLNLSLFVVPDVKNNVSFSRNGKFTRFQLVDFSFQGKIHGLVL